MIDFDKIPDIDIPAEDAQWLTCFTEGDGWLTYDSTNDKFMVGYEQKDPQVLKSIRTLLSPWSKGSMFPVSWGGWRLQYSAKYFTYGLMQLFSRHVITAHWSKLLNTPKHEPTYPGIAGFWDAEGHSSPSTADNVHMYLAIYFGQKEREVLDDIKALLRAGSVSVLTKSGTVVNIKGRTVVVDGDTHHLCVTTKVNSPLISALLQYSHDTVRKQKLLANIKEVEKWPTTLKAIKEFIRQRDVKNDEV